MDNSNLEPVIKEIKEIITSYNNDVFLDLKIDMMLLKHYPPFHKDEVYLRYEKEEEAAHHLTEEIIEYIKKNKNNNPSIIYQIPNSILLKYIDFVKYIELKIIYQTFTPRYDNNKINFYSYKDYSISEGKLDFLKSIFSLYANSDNLSDNLFPLVYHFIIFSKNIFEILKRINNAVKTDLPKIEWNDELTKRIIYHLFNDILMISNKSIIQPNDFNLIFQSFEKTKTPSAFIKTLPLYSKIREMFILFDYLNQNGNHDIINQKISSLYHRDKFNSNEGLLFFAYVFLYNVFNYFVQYLFFIQNGEMNHFFNCNK